MDLMKFEDGQRFVSGWFGIEIPLVLTEPSLREIHRQLVHRGCGGHSDTLRGVLKKGGLSDSTRKSIREVYWHLIRKPSLGRADEDLYHYFVPLAQNRALLRRLTEQAKTEAVNSPGDSPESSEAYAWEEWISGVYMRMLDIREDHEEYEWAQASPCESNDQKEVYRWPYGMWTLKDGREIIFDRNRQSLWERCGGMAQRKTVPVSKRGESSGPPPKGLLHENYFNSRTESERLLLQADFYLGQPVDTYFHKKRD